MKFEKALVAFIVFLGTSVCAVAQPFSLFLWVELIGFDNSQSDFGVGAYLERMERAPDAISLLLDNDRLFRTHDAKDGDFLLPEDCCAYGGRPYNVERRRQAWTSNQLKGLVKTLRDRGIDVYASFFNRTDALPTNDARMREIAGQLTSFLVDYGFSGFHCSDGFAPPSYVLPKCDDRNRVEVARKAARRYADNIALMTKELKAKDLRIWMNTCWTLDPFEALYRFGVDYQLLAETGVDGFIVESSAAVLNMMGKKHIEASRADLSTAMLLRLKAAVPNVKFVLLHGINDGNEQWSALRHNPTGTKSEVLTLGTMFYRDKRILDGYLACLSDGIRAEEWKDLFKAWRLSMTPLKGPVGVSVVWSDRAFRKEFETCTVSHDASSNTLLCELVRQGMAVNSSLRVEDALADTERPLIILNPEFFPEDELKALRARKARVYEFGRGCQAPFLAEYVPRPDNEPFPGMPQDTSIYFSKPLSENRPQDCSSRLMAMYVNWLTTPYETWTEGLRTWCVRMDDGRLGIFARNDGERYVTAQIYPKKCVADVRVHTEFPSRPVTTILQLKVAPRETAFISVSEGEFPLPAPLDGENE